jgi:CheY-like chemotaxis protein
MCPRRQQTITAKSNRGDEFPHGAKDSGAAGASQTPALAASRRELYVCLVATILIIDDDADGSEVLARYLEYAGHRAIEAPNGHKALAMLTTAHPDVVVLDLMMPQLDGIGFLKVLRSVFVGLELPVIILTGSADGPRLQRVGELGVKRVFRKADYRLSDLLECVNQCLEVNPPVTLDVCAGSPVAAPLIQNAVAAPMPATASRSHRGFAEQPVSPASSDPLGPPRRDRGTGGNTTGVAWSPEGRA